MKKIKKSSLKNSLIWILLIFMILTLSIIAFGCNSSNGIEEKLVEPSADTMISHSSSEDKKLDQSEEEDMLEKDNAPTFGGATEKNGEGYSSASAYSIPLIDGLHVTGTPIEIDIETYRLKITGLVEEELEFSFAEIKNMEAVKIYAELNCPGFFVDKGYWTGVRISDLLNIAGIAEEAKTLKFIEVGGGYVQELPINKIYENKDNYLISYYFNDNDFSEIHGYPLRVVAKGEPGVRWVKWLGQIEAVE